MIALFYFFSVAQIEKQADPQIFIVLCETGNGPACLLASMIAFDNGELQKMVDFGTKSCSLDYGKGCLNLGAMYENGRGVKQDDFKAVEFYTKACSLDNGKGCFNLGVMFEYGSAVRQSNEKALEYFNKACVLKNAEGCKRYTMLKQIM